MKLLRNAAAVLGIAATFGALTSAPAFADAGRDGGTCDNSCDAGRAYFTHDYLNGTELLEVFDDKADGHSVMVENWRYDLDDIGPYPGYVHTGKGTSTKYVLHMPEGSRIDFRVCLAEGKAKIESTCGTRVVEYA